MGKGKRRPACSDTIVRTVCGSLRRFAENLLQTQELRPDLWAASLLVRVQIRKKERKKGAGIGATEPVDDEHTDPTGTEATGHVGGVTMMTTTAQQREHATAGEPMTPAQRRAWFAAGKSRGMDIDGLRSLTPRGSISALSRAEAARILTSLNRGTDHEHPRRSPRRPHRPAGVYAFASDAQRRKIEALRIDLGWTPEKFQEWLSERHHGDGRPMTRIDSTTDAQAVIELLKVVLSRTATRRDGDHSGTPGSVGDTADPAPLA